MEKLLERGADPNLADKTDRENQPFYDYGGPFSNCLTETPLHKVIKTAIGARPYEDRDIEKDLNVINILLNHGARLTSDNESFASLLCKGEKPEVSALLKRERPAEMEQLQQVWQRAPRSPEEKRAEKIAEKYGGSKLMAAIEMKDHSKVEALLESAEANGKATDILNKQYVQEIYGTPLAKAAFECDLAMMDMLLKAGADPNQLIVDLGSRCYISTLLAVAKSPKLHDASETARNAVLNKLLDCGADIKNVVLREVRPGGWGSRPNLKVWEFFLRAGADLESLVPFGRTALMSAARSGSLEEVKFLLDEGANVNRKGEKDTTALHEAMSAWDGKDVIEMLIERGADKDAINSEGFTPLALVVKHAASTEKTTLAKEDKLDKLKLLIDSDADVNTQNPHSGDTPLLLCLKGEWGSATVDQLNSLLDSLLEAGADPRIADHDGNAAATLWAANRDIVQGKIGPRTYGEVAEKLEKRVSELNADGVSG